MLNFKSDAEAFAYHWEELNKITKRNGWGDHTVPGRGREIHMANTLGHTIAKAIVGPDAFNKDIPVEYKSSSSKIFAVEYAGISMMETWNKQIQYLKEKLLECPEHYHARYVDGAITEVYKMDASDVYRLLLPKLKKSYAKSASRKNPTVRAKIGETTIRRFGKLVWSNSGMLPL